MKKINTLLKNEKVQATLVIAGVFVITAIVSIWAYFQS
jgi:fumarate reductase subunit C